LPVTISIGIAQDEIVTRAKSSGCEVDQSLSANSQRERDRGGGQSGRDGIEGVDVEGTQNVVAGEVFEVGADYDLVVAAAPRFLGSETPLGFVGGDRDRARDVRRNFDFVLRSA
jgi:hypothetical protein